ncbi:hypothetical protein DVH24_037181 [Malus domestica]|uniref:Uncharacterized protein n=1 Tax=Malus domestica TaxID=3750 RepID=A0A498HJ32_MALDO|nr:hypothetical protein DVH24_037181 [Malus domestica]
MLGDLHSNALEDFQGRLEQSLNKGEGFASSVYSCAQSSVSLRKDVQMFDCNLNSLSAFECQRGRTSHAKYSSHIPIGYEG